MSIDEQKRAAAARALEYVKPGMRLGLGTGSTAAHFVDLLGARTKEGLDVICVATSEVTEAQARDLGIRMSQIDAVPLLDLCVDGADEIDEELRMIKGGGGALLREKIVAMASERMIAIVDASKRVETLGAFPLPVEVVKFGHDVTRTMIEMMGADVGCEGKITLRIQPDGNTFVTDCGNYIYDCAFGSIDEPEALDDVLRMIPGVVESGLFIGVADLAIVASEKGIEVLEDDIGLYNPDQDLM